MTTRIRLIVWCKNVWPCFHHLKNHSGHVCDQTGDNLLALFHSAADAVAAALTIQQQSEAVLGRLSP
ncbi:MAG: hypothetical protein CM1200mP41_29380 [Gammaproteobacteria bacterium]|nr:MAG: hypothetical protein CM1200mP41_29380 [Gammaproteobacteria bacterium]